MKRARVVDSDSEESRTAPRCRQSDTSARKADDKDTPLEKEVSLLSSDDEEKTGSSSSSDDEPSPHKLPNQELGKGWRPRMSQTWEEIVEAVVKVVRPRSVDIGGWDLRKIGKDFPGGSNTRMFVNEAVLAHLLNTRLRDVMHGFDENGRSFIGFMCMDWPWYAKDAAMLWLSTGCESPVPRVFTSHDYDDWTRRTWTLKSTLIVFTRGRQLVLGMRASVKAGVHLGTPEFPEEFSRFVHPFVVEDVETSVPPCSRQHLRDVLDVVLTAPVDHLHWKFEDFDKFVPEDRHKWAVPVMRWFQEELKKKLIADAVRAAVLAGVS